MRSSPRSGERTVTTGLIPSLMIHVRIGLLGSLTMVTPVLKKRTPGRRTAAGEVRMRLVDHVQHRTAMTESADALLGRRGEGRVDKERASSLLGRRDARGQLRRRSRRGELPERSRGEEVRVGSLEFCNGIELRRSSVRRCSGNGRGWRPSACSCSVGARPSWIRTGSSAGVFRVDGMPRNTVTCVAPGSSAIETHGGSGMVWRMVACAWTRVVPTPSSSSAS